MKIKENLSLYIHIPFCKKKCRYCDFWSGPASFAEREHYVEQLIRSINEQTVLAEEYCVKTIFFGGGTPSLLTGEQIQKILDSVRKVFCVDKSAEISMEVNPGTVTKEQWRQYHEAGVNRVSIGLQSANDAELRLLGRIHTYEMFLEAYHDARACGFQNINVDVISSLPGQTLESYLESLKKVVALQPEHISAYSLIIEPGTPFYDMFYDDRGKEKCYEENGQRYALLSEETDREIYHATEKVLLQAGYERYEISNYAKPGWECRHNCVYWTGGDYLGLGACASSLLKGVRSKNGERYPFFRETEEVLTNEAAMIECMMFGLRMTKGVSDTFFYSKFRVSVEEIFGDVVTQLIEQGLLQKTDGLGLQNGKDVSKPYDVRYQLTKKGLDLANVVMEAFYNTNFKRSEPS